jgi:hypothetical protein
MQWTCGCRVCAIEQNKQQQQQQQQDYSISNSNKA